MPQTTINNGDSGLTVRNSLNTMFGELYGALIIPTKLEGVNSNTTLAVAANSYIEYIAISATAGTPSIHVGTTPNGTDIIPATTPGNFSLTQLEQYFQNATTLYITISGGTVNMRVGLLSNFY